MRLNGMYGISVVLTFIILYFFIWGGDSDNQQILNTLSHNLKILSPTTNFVLSENRVSNNTFTLDKKYIFICLKNKNLNTLMYVAIHELAHIVSKEYGHTTEFIMHFQDLLKKAIELGVYTYVDYSQTPEPYCNMTLNTMILK